MMHNVLRGTNLSMISYISPMISYISPGYFEDKDIGISVRCIQKPNKFKIFILKIIFGWEYIEHEAQENLHMNKANAKIKYPKIQIVNNGE